MMELNSQRVRALAPENDPLKIGMGWTVEDLDKPQIHGREHLWRQPSGQRSSGSVCSRGYERNHRCRSKRSQILYH